MLSRKWVDTERGPRDRGAPPGCAGAAPPRLPSRVALDAGVPDKCRSAPSRSRQGAQKSELPEVLRKAVSAVAHTQRQQRGKVREPAPGRGCSSREGAAAAPRGLRRRRTVTLALARGPFRGLQTSKERERATRRRRGAALSRATPRVLAAGGRRGAARRRGSFPRNRCVPRPAGRFPPLGLALGRAWEFLRLCTTRPAAGGRGDPVREPRSLPGAPRAHGLDTAAPAAEDRALQRLPGSSCPPAPNPDLAGSSSYPKPGACGSAPAPTAPQLQPPSSSPEAARSARGRGDLGSGGNNPPPPRQSPEASGRAG